eukprot:scaffold6843_cov66-Phaeocystis_antarctica.AAC.1
MERVARGRGDGRTCGAKAAQARRKQCAGRAREERTRNIWPIFPTLETSKLSGWLNAAAFCRVGRNA